MLKQLRQKKVMKRILWGLAVVIIPAFVLWGAGGLRERAYYAGIVDGKKIPLDEYKAALDAVRNRARLVYGAAFYDIQDKLNLEKEAWAYLIILKEARKKNVKVSDGEVVGLILSLPSFRDGSGAFSDRIYRVILENALRTDPRTFEEQIRQLLMIERLAQEELKEIPAPDEQEIEEAVKKELEKKEEVKKQRALEEKKKEEADKALSKKEGAPSQAKEAQRKEPKEEKKEKEQKEQKEGKEEPKETSEEMRERVKNELMITKRMKAFADWQNGFVEKAGLVDNIKKEEEFPEEEMPLE